jgi:hypothetical protein
MARTDSAISLEDGPFTGQVDSGVYQAGKLRVAQNVYPQDPMVGERVIGRPGFYQLGGTLPGRLQGFAQFNGAGVGELSVAVSAGRVFRMAAGATTWVEPFTTADMTTAGVALSTGTAALGFQVGFLTVYVGGIAQLMISDGVNKPFLWNGSPGSGSLTPMPNCPVLYGPPTLYQSRVFGIKAADRLTMVWSETDNPLIGYDIAGGYGDVWSVRQTDNRPLSLVIGTNAGLFIARERSTTSAYGDVGPNFSSAATKDAVSGDVGTSFPFSGCVSGTNILLLDATCRPQMHRQGGQGYVPLWHDLRAHVAQSASNMNPQWGQGLVYPPANVALFLVPSTAGTALNQLWVYDLSGSTPVAVGTWSVGDTTGQTTVIGMVTLFNSALGQVPTLLVGDTTGHVYALADPNMRTVWNDQWASGTVPIAHAIETGELGYSTKRDKVFDRLDLAGEAPTQQTLSVSVIAPGMSMAAQTVVIPASSDDQHVEVGLDAAGRWARVHIDHAVLGEQFGVSALTLTGYPTDDDPPVP